MVTKLKQRRLEVGITQASVAKKAKVTERSYQAYEAGQSIPSAIIAIRIAEALDSSVEQLFSPE